MIDWFIDSCFSIKFHPAIQYVPMNSGSFYIVIKKTKKFLIVLLNY